MTYQFWLIAGFVLCVIEMFTMTFVLVWFGLSGILVGILTCLGIFTSSNLGVQALIFAILSAVMTGIWLSIQKKWKIRSLAGQSKESVLGTEGIVKNVRIHPEGTTGSVKFILPVFGHDEWEFVLKQNEVSQDDQALVHGDRVAIIDIVGQKLVVKKA